MAELGSVVSNIAPTAGSIVGWLIWGAIVLLIVIVVLGLIWYFGWKKRRWNLKVEIKLPRSDGNIINGEWGVGFYDAKRGVVLIKRAGKGSKAIAVKIFDVRRYMQGSDLITVIQVGPDDYRPVLNKSYSSHDVEYEDTDFPLTNTDGTPKLNEQGEQMYKTVLVKEAVINIQTDTGKNKAWRAAYEEAAKQAYTIGSMFRQYQTPIAIGIVVICCFVGFAVLWGKLSSVCSAFIPLLLTSAKHKMPSL